MGEAEQWVVVSDDKQSYLGKLVSRFRDADPNDPRDMLVTLSPVYGFVANIGNGPNGLQLGTMAFPLECLGCAQRITLTARSVAFLEPGTPPEVAKLTKAADRIAAEMRANASDIKLAGTMPRIS